MEVLAYIVFAFAVVQLLVATVNTLFSQPFPKSSADSTSLVSVLIPARNEEQNIGNLLNDLQNQEYKNIEMLVFNDQSTDKTAEIVSQFSEKDHRIKLYNSSELPEGWLGKNYGCYSLAKFAKGDYFLFLDADVRIEGRIIANTVSHSKKHQLGLLSIFPRQIMLSWGEYLTVPNMNYILLSLLPLALVRGSKFPSLAAANGQFMLFNSNIYKKTAPHEMLKTSKVEDIEIAGFYKKSNIKVACLTGKSEICCRMYSGFKDAVNGFSKNVIMFFGNSFLWAILFWTITSLGFIFVIIGLPIKLTCSYFLILILTRIFISVASKQNIFINLLLAFPQQLTMGLFIYKAIINQSKKAFEWKGRKIA